MTETESQCPARASSNRVVDDFVDQVVEAARAGRADVHARTFPNCLEALEHRDVFRPVGILRGRLVFTQLLPFRIEAGIFGASAADQSQDPSRRFGAKLQ